MRKIGATVWLFCVTNSACGETTATSDGGMLSVAATNEDGDTSAEGINAPSGSVEADACTGAAASQDRVVIDADGGADVDAGSTSLGTSDTDAGSNTEVEQESTVEEADLQRCAAGQDCVVVPYSHCCGATKKAINALYEQVYKDHSEWHVFADEDACAVIGMCAPDDDVTAAACVGNVCTLVR